MAARRPVRRRLKISVFGGLSISIRVEPLVVQIPARLISAHQFDNNSRSRSNSGPDGIFGRDRAGFDLG